MDVEFHKRSADERSKCIIVGTGMFAYLEEGIAYDVSKLVCKTGIAKIPRNRNSM